MRFVRAEAGFVRPNWLEPSDLAGKHRWMKKPVRYFNRLPEVIRLAVML
jgi:hypothetical protein